MKKILLLGSQHGNELLGEQLYKYIKTNRQELLPHIEYLVGNPRAKKAGIRYIDTDMNRSFDGGSKTYEQRRAKQVLKYIEANNFDLVLDLHTCFSVMPACLILPETFDGVKDYVRASSLDKVVLMSDDAVKNAFVGNCSKAVSVEVNRDSVTQTFLDMLCDDIMRYIEGTVGVATKTFYKAEPLPKDELSARDANKLVNFVKSEQGFYPIIVGENPYKKLASYKYLGFKAYSTERTKI